MRILHIATEDVTGGAARAAHRLHTGLVRLGHDSVMFVAHKLGSGPKVRAFAPPMSFAGRLRRLFRRGLIARSLGRYAARRPAGRELFSDDRSEYGSTLIRQLPPADVINLHWVAGFVDYPSFFRVIP